VILYLDTSALVKLYVDEEGAGQVRQRGQDAEIIATCEIAYVEVRAALARRHREGALKGADYRRALRNLGADWPRFFLITVSRQLVFSAGDIAERHHLRASDAVHLASGVAVQSQARESVTFACWDRSLAEAAAKAGLHNLPLRV
jgi:predicted nucleic acid-binding protein